MMRMREGGISGQSSLLLVKLQNWLLCLLIASLVNFFLPFFCLLFNFEFHIPLCGRTQCGRYLWSLIFLTRIGGWGWAQNQIPDQFRVGDPD